MKQTIITFYFKISKNAIRRFLLLKHENLLSIRVFEWLEIHYINKEGLTNSETNLFFRHTEYNIPQ